METLHVKISDKSKKKIRDYMEQKNLKNMDDASEQFIQNAKFEETDDSP